MVGSHRPGVSTLRPRVSSLTKIRPRVSALTPRVGFLRAMVSSHRLMELGPSDLGLASLKLLLTLKQLIDLELTPSYLGLVSSQKVIDLRLSPLHKIRVRARVRVRVQNFPNFKNPLTRDQKKIPQLMRSLHLLIAPSKLTPNGSSYTTDVFRIASSMLRLPRKSLSNIFLINSISPLSLCLVQIIRGRCTNVDIRLALRLRGLTHSQRNHWPVKVGFWYTLVSKPMSVFST